MAKKEQQKKFRWQAHKPLLAATLAVAGVFNMVGAVLAEGTAANQNISNTATATYDDGNGNNFNATSNTVVVKVAEIAGLTVTASPVIDVDGGAIESGDDLVYTFTVTNVGNADTDVFVPGIGNIRQQNFTPSATDPVKVYQADGTTLIGTVAAGGSTIVGLGGAPIAADASFVVKVTGTPTAGIPSGTPITVTLGNTDDNPTIEGTDQTQNQSDNDDEISGNNGVNADDVRTVNSGPDSPENGEREAQDTASANFGGAVRPLALATVLKTAGPVVAGVPSDPTDDKITYTLGLRVEGTEPNNLFQPAALEGTNINLDGAPTKRILVSDAIPAQTKLTSVSTTLPTGWTAVYSIDPAGAAVGSDPLAIAWQTAIPTDLSTVTRIGFVKTGTVNVGAAVTGLKFTVVTSGLLPTGGTIENLAQIFGQSVGDPNVQIIYDESGDANPNNYSDAGNPPTADGSDYVPGTDDGIAPETDTNGDNQPDDLALVDNNNDNTGTGDDGEVNVVSITPTTDDILNGTQDTPNAVGPTGSDNDDFTNLSTPVPAGLDPQASFDPDEITFNNSLSNPAATGFIAEVTIEPLSPSEAEAAGGVPGAYGVNGDIPIGTTVTITSSDGTKTAVYTYNGTTFTTTDTPVNVGDVTAGTEVDYTVKVNLPSGVLQLRGISIPIVAFPDDDPGTPANAGYTNETITNITIDRVYTGFMSLVKEARILDVNGNPRVPFTDGVAPNPLLPNAAPGEVIEYRITYQNISQSATGSGSITLTANGFVILEDGNATPNNWAQYTTHQAGATASAGTLRYYTTSADTTPAATSPTNPADGTPTEKYDNSIPSVAPGTLPGTFLIRRMVD